MTRNTAYCFLERVSVHFINRIFIYLIWKYSLKLFCFKGRQGECAPLLLCSYASPWTGCFPTTKPQQLSILELKWWILAPPKTILKRMAQISVSALCHVTSSRACCTLGNGILHLLTEKSKVQASFTDGCAQYVLHQPRNGEMALKDSVEGSICSGQDSQQSTWLFILPQREYGLRLQEPSVWADGPGLGRNTAGKLITGQSLQELCGWTSSVDTEYGHICVT